MPYMEPLWFLSTYHAPLLGCVQNHSCMGSLPDSSAVREESGTETSVGLGMRVTSSHEPPTPMDMGVQ